jgi:hypothetical protein
MEETETVNKVGVRNSRDEKRPRRQTRRREIIEKYVTVM